MTRKSLLTLMFLCVLTVGFGQTRLLNRIDRLYDQGLYQKSLKKSEKLIRDRKHRDHPLPYLYQSLNLYELSQNPDKKRKYRHGLRNALMAYQQFRQRDTRNRYAAKRLAEVEELHQAIRKEADRLHNTGQNTEARFFHRQLATLWRDTTSAYVAIYHKEIQGVSNPVENPENETLPLALNTLRDSLVSTAHGQIGVPYKYGGQTPSGFDCSGFTGYTYKTYGLKLPRKSGDQSTIGYKVPVKRAQKGDLAFFGVKKGHDVKITHVAMVVSDPGDALKVIHATSSKGVMVSNVTASNYWRPRLLFVVNVLDDLTASE